MTQRSKLKSLMSTVKSFLTNGNTFVEWMLLAYKVPKLVLHFSVKEVTFPVLNCVSGSMA